MLSKYKVKPRDVVRYEIVKYKVSPINREQKGEVLVAQSEKSENKSITQERGTEKRSSSRRALPDDKMRQSGSNLRLKKASAPVLFAQGPSIFSPLSGARIHDDGQFEERQEIATTAKKGRRPAQFIMNPSHSVGNLGRVVPPTQAQFSTKQHPRAVFTTNAIIRRPSTGETLSMGKPKFLATAYTTNYAPPDQMKEANQTGPLFFQPTRSTSAQRAYKDRRGGSPPGALSPSHASTAHKLRGNVQIMASPRHLVMEESEFLSQMTRQLLARINKLRQRPKTFIPVLSQKLQKYRDQIYLMMPDGQFKKTKEGRRAVEEAVGELEMAESVGVL